LLVPLLASALFLTSALLFVLEPLVAKGLLPVLGGGAAVWTTSVAFFQLALLAGYAYAHLAPSWLRPRRHAVIHVALLAGAAIALPLRAPAGLVAPAQHQAIWLFGRLAVSIGPTFVLLAATAPLLQRWLASTGHRDARDPYFLYAASNAGSLLALAAYPVLLEPLAGLDRQRRLWMGGLALAVGLLAASAGAAWRAGLGTRDAPTDGGARAAEPAVSAATRLRWLVLAAVPSSLLLSVTSYLTTDVVALPLLWVVPLALYLLTFILAFARRTFVSPRRVVWIQAMFLVPIAAEMFMRTEASAPILVPLHVCAFFATALMCHQTLARSRPPAARSTEFYLYVAAGGALGGLFNVFAAPLIFRSLLEYPIGLIAATLLRPAPEDAQPTTPRARRLDLVLPIALGALLLAGVRAAHAMEAHAGAKAGLIALIVLLTAAAVTAYSFRWRPLRFGLALAAIMASGATYAKGASRTLYTVRSFYGAHKVILEPPAMLTLWHGNTAHGAQDLAPARRREPLTYFHPTGPIGGVMAAWQGRPQRRRVGLVGLGAGSLAAYADPGERWTFYEIDPAVIDIARDRDLFTFLADARAAVDVVPGDGRLSLTAVPDATFGMLVFDAFSSDAVPAHLLTREAFALYLRKLGPGGVIAVHVSNRYLDLGSIVAGNAAALGLSARVRFDTPTDAEASAGKRASHWMVVGRTTDDLAPLAADPRWTVPGPCGPGWTDDASNVWGVLHVF
jgi:SAM-dependent methyltransferase